MKERAQRNASVVCGVLESSFLTAVLRRVGMTAWLEAALQEGM
jgi:hypothetical protein